MILSLELIDLISHQGYCYGRFGNPTVDVLQHCIAGLDSAKHCLVYPSGCAAATALLNLMRPGDHYMASNENYGGPRTLFERFCKDRDIEIDFFDPTDLQQIRDTIKPNTKVICCLKRVAVDLTFICHCHFR